MKKILITGSNGFIGSYLYSKLNEESALTSIDFSKSASKENSIKLDLTDINQVNNFSYNCVYFDTLIFLVGLAHSKGKGKDLPEFKKVNYQTLVNLLSSLERNNKVPKKIIFSSTISVYGEKYYQNIYNEESEKNPFSPYAVTKLDAEQYLLNNYPDKSWIMRFAPVYSPDFHLNINRRTKVGGLFYKIGNGYKKLSLCNLGNIWFSVHGILENNVPAGIYNISDAKDYTYAFLLKSLNAKWIIPIPNSFIKLIFYVGKVTKNIFLKENSIKLISDNIFPSNKIQQFISLPYVLDDNSFDSND